VPKRIPIAEARRVAEAQGLSQVILVGWDGEATHVVTYGRSQADCEQAARGGNLIKKALGFPLELCEAKPARQVRKEKRRAAKRGDTTFRDSELAVLGGDLGE